MAKTFTELRESRTQYGTISVDEISIASLTKAVAGSTGTKNVRKAMNTDKIKADLKAMQTRKKKDDEKRKYGNMRFAEFVEATYQGKKVPLNKPMPGDVKKSKVYVDPDGDGKAKKVNFGDKNMTIKKSNPARRKSFRARHNCDNPGPKDKARYWSCKAW